MKVSKAILEAALYKEMIVLKSKSIVLNFSSCVSFSSRLKGCQAEIFFSMISSGKKDEGRIRYRGDPVKHHVIEFFCKNDYQSKGVNPSRPVHFRKLY